VASKRGFESVGPILRLRIFGAIEAWSWAGEHVLPRGRKAQAILAYLALSEDVTVPRQRLIKLLWSKRWDEQARASLRQSLMELRRCIGHIDPGLLVIEKDRVSLQGTKVWIDGIGVLSEVKGQAPMRQASQQADRLLESLRGLDAAFDHWIETRSKALINQSEAAARIGAVPAVPGLGDLSVPRKAPSATGGSDLVIDDDLAATARPEHCENRRLTVAVTPFIDLDGDPNTTHLSSAFTREVVAALARFRWFIVRLGSLDEAQQCDYRLDGSVSTGLSDYRVAVRLLDCRASEHPVWAHERNVERTVLQDFLGNVAERVVEHVDPEILSIETRRARTKASVDCVAYECLLRAIHLVYSFERENWEVGRTLLEQAIVKDPQFGRAYAVSAVARSTALSQGWIAPTETEIATLDAYATRAIECDPYDSMALAISAHTRLRVKQDFDYAMPMYERALKLNPSCGFAWGYSAIAHGYLGQTEEAMSRLARARDLMVYDSFGQFLDSFDMPISYFSRDWSRTIALGEQFAARGVRVNNMYKLLVGALCQVGRFEEARRYNRGVMQREPGFSWRRFIAGYPFGLEQDRLSLAVAIARGGLIDDVDAGSADETSNVVTLRGNGRHRAGHRRTLGKGT
jgi:TolB-like protein